MTTGKRSEDAMESSKDASRLCEFCQLTLKKPMQSPCSGFRFCKDCAENLQNDYVAYTCCPFCKHPDSFQIYEIFSDKAAERELLASKTLSPADSDGFHENNNEDQNVTRAGAGNGRGIIQVQERAGEALVGSPTQSTLKKASMGAEKMPIYQGVITVLNREVEKLTLKLEAMDRQRRQEREQLEAMDRKVKTLERSVALKDATISELEMRITALEQTSYDGTLLWKITDFSRRRQEAISGRMTSIYSPAFYTGKEGYKMCARLCLNGDGMGKGTHVSLFFVIVRGQYDALLKWPFHHKVMFTFLDQSGKDQHVVDGFHPDPTSSSFKRPTEDMNIASGCPLFMPLASLSNPSHVFIKEDTGFIQISVSPHNLN